MTTLHELEELLKRERTYFAGRGAKLTWRLWPPATTQTLSEIENRLSLRLPAAYAAFLTITGGLWLKLIYPDREHGGAPLEDSAGLNESDVVQRATEAVRDLIDCVTIARSSKAIGIGQDGLIGDRIVLWTGDDPARVVACTNDEPGRFLDPVFEIAPSFERFMERFLGASQEGREKITFWMD